MTCVLHPEPQEASSSMASLQRRTWGTKLQHKVQVRHYNGIGLISPETQEVRNKSCQSPGPHRLVDGTSKLPSRCVEEGLSHHTSYVHQERDEEGHTAAGTHHRSRTGPVASLKAQNLQETQHQVTMLVGNQHLRFYHPTRAIKNFYENHFGKSPPIFCNILRRNTLKKKGVGNSNVLCSTHKSFTPPPPHSTFTHTT